MNIGSHQYALDDITFDFLKSIKAQNVVSVGLQNDEHSGGFSFEPGLTFPFTNTIDLKENKTLPAKNSCTERITIQRASGKEFFILCDSDKLYRFNYKNEVNTLQLSKKYTNLVYST